VHKVFSPYSNYQKYLQLGDGRNILLRSMISLDCDLLADLLQEASRKAVRFIKFNRKDLEGLTHPGEQLDYRTILPLVAVDLEAHRFIASANLHLGQDAASLAGEISLYVSEPFHGLGLHSLLVDEIIGLAEKNNLRWLKAEVVGACPKTRETLLAKGFEARTMMQDFYLSNNGAVHDVVVMMRPVGGAGSA
jgi:GNAT superfamily N-acetyltransferase